MKYGGYRAIMSGDAPVPPPGSFIGNELRIPIHSGSVEHTISEDASPYWSARLNDFRDWDAFADDPPRWPAWLDRWFRMPWEPKQDQVSLFSEILKREYRDLMQHHLNEQSRMLFGSYRTKPETLARYEARQARRRLRNLVR